MLEAIKIIALLCQIDAGNNIINNVEFAQRNCQQKYLKCIRKQSPTISLGHKLEKCVVGKE